MKAHFDSTVFAELAGLEATAAYMAVLDRAVDGIDATTPRPGPLEIAEILTQARREGLRAGAAVYENRLHQLHRVMAVKPGQVWDKFRTSRALRAQAVSLRKLAAGEVVGSPGSLIHD